MSPQSAETSIIFFPSKVYNLPQPLGVCLILGAWNYPFSTVLTPLITAISAGNCCVVKPSEVAPYSSKVVKDIVDQMDQRYFRALEGGRETGVYLNKLPFNLLIFTGGTKVGKFILKDAAENMTKCILELGGKNHTIVDKSANIELTAKRLANLKVLNCGQTCLSTDYVFVDKEISRKFITELKKELTALIGSDASQNPEYSRLIHKNHAQAMVNLLQGQRENIIYEPGQINVDSKFVPITVVLNPIMDSNLMKDEIFGPILPVIEYSSFGEVINFVKKNPSPLVTYYFGDTSSDNYRYIKENTSSGSLLANDTLYSYISFSQGFGGVGDSGQGKIHGYPGFIDCSHLKPIIERPRSALLDPPMRYGPSNASKLRQLRFVMESLGGKTIEPYFNRIKKIMALMVPVLLVYYLFYKNILVLNLNK